jgi:hypothetical protein
MFADMEMDSAVFKAIRNFQKINKSRGRSKFGWYWRNSTHNWR